MKKSIFSVACALILAAILGPSITPANAQPKKAPTNLELLNLALSKVKPGQKFIFFGDMGVPVQRIRAQRDLEAGIRTTSSAFDTNTKYWPGGKVPYDIDPSLPQADQDAFIQSCREWEKWANLTFFPRTTEANYIHVFKDPNVNNASYSMLGMIGGAQNFSLAPNQGVFNSCHELGHALGVDHEHQRSDRDQFVTINFDNVGTGEADQFTIIGNTKNIGTYDFESIMHYDETAFSVDGVKKTIVVKPGYENFQKIMGRSAHAGPISELDKVGMSTIYGFPAGVTATPIPTATLPPRPTIAADQVSVKEGDPGDDQASVITFKIRLTQAPKNDVSFSYKIVRDPIQHDPNSSDPSASTLSESELDKYSAIPNVDYIDNNTQGTITLPAATTNNNDNSTREASISVTIKGDKDVENDESLLLVLSDPVNSRFINNQSTLSIKGIILNDDAAPTPTPYPTPTITPIPSATPKPTATPKPSPTATPVVTGTPKPTSTPKPTPSPTPVSGPTANVSLLPVSPAKDAVVTATVKFTPSSGTTGKVVWKLNGRVIVKDVYKVDFGRVTSEKKGDTITVEVTPTRNGVTGNPGIGTAVIGNTAPTADNVSATTRSAVPVTVNLSGSDLDGDDLSYIITSKPESGTATIKKTNGRSTLTYSSDVGFIGSESIGIAATDGTDRSLDAAVRINVNANTPPKLGSITPVGNTYLTGQAITFKQVVSDSESNLQTVYLLLSNSSSAPDTTNALYAVYDVATKTFRLQNSAGTAFSNPKGVGQSTSNTQALVTLRSVTQSSGTLTLAYEVTAQLTFTGTKTFWSSAEDTGTLRADFTQKGKVVFNRRANGAATFSAGDSE